MSKDEIIAMLRVTITELQADKARLMDMLQASIEDNARRLEVAANESGEQRSRWREQKRKQREVSPMSGGQSVDSPVDNADKRESGSSSEGSLGSPPDNPRSLLSVTPTPREKTNTARSREDGAQERWLLFRATYPKTDRTSWSEAEKRFAKLSLLDQGAATHGARQYAAKDRSGPRGEDFTKAAQSWLLERRWETVEDVGRNGTGTHDQAPLLPGVTHRMVEN